MTTRFKRVRIDCNVRRKTLVYVHKYRTRSLYGLCAESRTHVRTVVIMTVVVYGTTSSSTTGLPVPYRSTGREKGVSGKSRKKKENHLSFLAPMPRYEETNCATATCVWGPLQQATEHTELLLLVDLRVLATIAAV